MHLLLIEDDPMIGDSVVGGLRAEGYALDRVRDREGILLALVADICDLLLRALGLPGRDGLELPCQSRTHGATAPAPPPVLILTARDSTADRVQGLDCGADDDLVKPFELAESFARVRALPCRRASRSRPDTARRGLTLRAATHEALVAGRKIALSAHGFSLLAALLAPPLRALSRARPDSTRCGWHEEIESNTVDVDVHRQRKKPGADFIRNVRRLGHLAPLYS